MKNETPSIHYGTIISHTGTAVLLKLQSGITIAVLWESEGDPPQQGWWNDRSPEWTTIEAVMESAIKVCVNAPPDVCNGEVEHPR